MWQIWTSVAPIVVVVQILSFGSSVALAQSLGASTETDAYFLALSIPVIAYSILVAALRLGAIPALTDVSEDSAEFDEAASQLTAAVAIVSVLASAVLTVAAYVGMPALAGTSQDLADAARPLALELAPYAVAGALLGVLGAILAVRRRFVAAVAVLAYEPVLKTVLVLGFGDTLGADALVIGNLLGGLLAVANLWWLVLREGVKLRFAVPRMTGVLLTTTRLSIALLVSQSILQVNPLVDRALSSPLGAGSVTQLELGMRLFTVPMVLLGATLIAPLAATWSAKRKEGGWPLLSESVGRVLTLIMLVVPGVVGVGIPLTALTIDAIYGGGAFSIDDVQSTADVFAVLLVGLLPQILVVPLSTLFVVQRNVKVPLMIAAANVVLNFVISSLLREPFGVAGVAAGTVSYLQPAVSCVRRLSSPQMGEPRYGGQLAADL